MAPPILSHDGQSDYSGFIKRAEQTRQARLGMAHTERGDRHLIHPVDRPFIPDNFEDHLEESSLGSTDVLEAEQQGVLNTYPIPELYDQPKARASPSSRDSVLLSLSSRKGLRFAILAREILGTPRGFI